MTTYTGMGGDPAPRLNPNCQCICHTQPGVMHIVACCHEKGHQMTHQTDEELDTLVMRLLDFNGDGHTRFAGKTMTENAADAITTLRARVSQLEGAVMTGQGEQIRLAADLLQAKIECNEANARAALAASLPADPVTNAGCCQPVRVKPLVWTPRPDGRQWYGHAADGLYLSFTAVMSAETGEWSCFLRGLWRPFETIESAKAAAQADYEARVLDALEPIPVTMAEAAKVLLSNRAALAAMVDAAEEAHEKGVSFDVVIGRALRAIREGEA